MPKYSVSVWKMLVSVFKDDDGYLKLGEMADRVHNMYPNENVKKPTIRLQTIFHCVNHPGTKHDVSRRYERNPLFFTDGEKGFRLLTEAEKKKYKKK
jgi:hypothetical protein